MSIDHWMTFGTFAERRFFIYPDKDTYDGIIINANMAAHAPDGMAAFLLEQTKGHCYLIDPMTHAFQHQPMAVMRRVRVKDEKGKETEKTKWVLKSSIEKLANAYGEPVVGLVGKQALLPKTLLGDEDLLRDFVDRALAFQETQLADVMANADVMKYFGGTEDLRPHALIAPYFCITEETLNDWLPLCRKCMEMAADLRKKDGLFGMVAVDQGILQNKENKKAIIEQLGGLSLSGYLLWVNDFDEHEAPAAQLQGLLEIAKGLRGEQGAEVINRHGGYFSVLAAGVLGEGAFTGVAHGPEFGEYRAFVPVGGGIPISRYYVPKLHQRCRYQEVVGFLHTRYGVTDLGPIPAERFHAEVCGCSACVEAIDGNVANFTRFGEATPKRVRRGKGLARIEYPTARAKAYCLKHYLQRKRKEYEMAATANDRVLLQDLKDGHKQFEAVAGINAVAHLRRWSETLRPGSWPTD